MTGVQREWWVGIVVVPSASLESFPSLMKDPGLELFKGLPVVHLKNVSMIKTQLQQEMIDVMCACSM